MGIILDVIVIAIFALNIFICYKKGLVRLAVGLIAVLTAIVLSIILYKPISNLVIKNTGLDKKIENVIIENFSAETKDGQEVKYVGLIDYLQKYVDDAVTKTQNEIAKMMGISRSYVSRIETKAIKKLAEEIKE